MCEHCKAKADAGEPIDKEEGPVDCESERCRKRAKFVVVAPIVEHHLCEAHKKKLKSDLDGGMEDFLKSSGLHEDFKFIVIRPGEECDYVAPLDMLKNTPICGALARYAYQFRIEQALCAKHAKEWGYAPPIDVQ